MTDNERRSNLVGTQFDAEENRKKCIEDHGTAQVLQTGYVYDTVNKKGEPIKRVVHGTAGAVTECIAKMVDLKLQLNSKKGKDAEQTMRIAKLEKKVDPACDALTRAIQNLINEGFEPPNQDERIERHEQNATDEDLRLKKGEERAAARRKAAREKNEAKKAKLAPKAKKKAAPKRKKRA